MSRIIAGDNSIDATNVLFKLRSLYEKEGFPSEALDDPNNPYNSVRLDMNYTKPLYGKIDYESNSVEPINKNEIIKQFPSATELYAMNFVVDAFEDFIEKYNRACQFIKGQTTQPPIGQIGPIKAWEDPLLSYKKHMNSVYIRFIKTYLNNVNPKEKVTIKQFLNHFFKFAIANAKNFPIFYSSYCVSRFCSPRISGLIVEIDDHDFGDDLYKTRDYINNTNFSLYKEMTKRYGFIIDQNAPWRLIANVMSSTMVNRAKKYNMYSHEDIFKTQFLKSYKKDFELLMEELFAMNAYAGFNPIYRSVEISSSCKVETVEYVREILREKSDLLKYFDDATFLKIYSYFRAREININVQQNQLDAVMTKAYTLTKSRKDIQYGMEYINLFFNGFKSEIIMEEARTSKTLDLDNQSQYSDFQVDQSINFIL